MKAQKFWMFRALAMAGALFFLASLVHAQTQTNVTATIVDPLGIPYANGTYSVQLIPSGTNPTVNGNSIGGAFNGRLDQNGSFNVSLWPNSAIVPGGTLWQFTICIPGGIAPPLGTGSQCTPPTAVTISGTSQSLSATLSAVAPALTTITLGGMGAVVNCSTTGGVGFENGTADTLTCDPQFLWDESNLRQYTGVPQSTFEASYQNWLGPNPSKLWVAEEFGTQFATAFFQMEGLTGTSPVGIWNSIHAHNALPETMFSEIVGLVDGGQTVGSSVNQNNGTSWTGPGTVTKHIDFFASPNYTGSVQVGTSIGHYGNLVLGDAGTTITNSMDFEADRFGGTSPGTITNYYGFHSGDHGNKAATISAAFFAAAQSNGDGHSWGFFSAPSNSDSFGFLKAVTYSTATNCSGVGTAANPSVASCAAAPAGSFSCATNASTGTCQVNTTKVTANSQIIVQEDDSLGTKLGVTCNTNNVLPATAPLLGARNPGTSFTINLGTFTTNPLCYTYLIVN